MASEAYRNRPSFFYARDRTMPMRATFQVPRGLCSPQIPSPRTASRKAFLAHFLGLFALSAVLGCDKDPPSSTSRTDPPKTTAAPSAPAPPRKPEIFVEDAAATISGERVDFAAPDVKGRLAVTLQGKPIAGETIDIIATRDAKVPRVGAVFGAVASAKPKGVVVKTAKRDKTTAELPLAIGAKREGCAVVAHVAKDSVINIWPAGGGTGARFSRGLAGPDLTRSSEGIRKALAACDAPTWFVTADDAVTWGLLVDLIVAVTHPEDGGAPLPAKPREVSLLVKQATPGKPVDAD